MFNQEEFGKRVVKLRKGKKYSQEKLAEILGVSREFLGRMERGQKGPSIEMQIALSKEFDVSIDYLILGYETGLKQAMQKNVMEMTELVARM